MTLHGEEVPVPFLYPKSWNGRTVLWLSDSGKSGLLRDGKPLPPCDRCSMPAIPWSGWTCCSRGIRSGEGILVTRTRRSRIPRGGVLHLRIQIALFTQRVHDVLTTLSFVRSHERPSKRVLAVAVIPDRSHPRGDPRRRRNSLDAAAVDTADSDSWMSRICGCPFSPGAPNTGTFPVHVRPIPGRSGSPAKRPPSVTDSNTDPCRGSAS